MCHPPSWDQLDFRPLSSLGGRQIHRQPAANHKLQTRTIPPWKPPQALPGAPGTGAPRSSFIGLIAEGRKTLKYVLYVSHVAYGAAVTTMLEPAQRGSPNSSSHSSCNGSCQAKLLYTTDTSHVKWSMMSMHKSDRKSEDQCIAPSVKNWFQIWPSLWFDVAIAHEAAQGNACTKKIGNPPARILSKCIVSP